MRKLAKRTLIFSALLFWSGWLLASPALAAPFLANYYLGTLPTDEESIRRLGRTDVIIISPEQAIVGRSALLRIKQLNPAVKLLAYIPAKSYDIGWTRPPKSEIFKDFTVQDNWWLRDSAGRQTSDWPGHLNTNLDVAASDYLISFVKNQVLPVFSWDGIFWDVVYDGISWFNGGDIDLNGDGVKDNPALADAEWRRRTVYLLEQSRARLPVNYIVINGSSRPEFQTPINGRMYESFPTPWEAGGSWSGLLSVLEKNQTLNRGPLLNVFNANSNNSGDRTDYRRVRFGLASSLLLDNVFFSYDHGTDNHAQVWWYDEYSARLGNPSGRAATQGNAARFTPDVWRRDFEHGLALVNATPSEQTIDLGGEYEKLIGTQDATVNDGTIVTSVTLPPQDGLIMFKTFHTLADIFFVNGGFVRFFDSQGERARNGFFVYEEGRPGGARIYNGDLNGDATPEKIVISGAKVEIFNDQGARWYQGYPFGGNFKGEIRAAVGWLDDKINRRLVLAPSAGGRVVVMTYFGEPLAELYPLGKKYQGGFSVALGNVDGGDSGEVVVGVGSPGRRAEVIVYASDLKAIKRRWFPFTKNYRGGVFVAVGDFTGDGQLEVAAVSGSDKRPLVRIFNGVGKSISEFSVRGFFGAQNLDIAVSDVNFEGVKEVVLLSKN